MTISAPKPVIDAQQNPSVPPVPNPEARIAELSCYALYLGFAICQWDRMTLQQMAPIAALETSESPSRKPCMEQISYLFGFLAKAIEGADFHQTRNTLSEMLRAARLA